MRSKVPTSTISARFHRTLAELFVQTAVTARAKRGIDRVGLSGGVFQNQYFLIDEEEAKKTYEVWEGLVEAAAEEGTDIFGMPLQEDGKDSDKTTPKP